MRIEVIRKRGVLGQSPVHSNISRSGRQGQQQRGCEDGHWGQRKTPRGVLSSSVGHSLGPWGVVSCGECCGELKRDEAGELTICLSNVEVLGDFAKGCLCVIIGKNVCRMALRETKRTDIGNSKSRKLFWVNFVEQLGEGEANQVVAGGGYKFQRGCFKTVTVMQVMS